MEATNKRKSGKKISVFPIVNGILFLIICLIILVPIWKVLVDSFDLTTGYGMKLWPDNFGLDGYTTVLTNPSLATPLKNSVITTVNERVLETRIDDLQPGDIFIGNGTKMGKPTEYYWIYNGEKLLDWNGGKVKELKQKDLTKALSFEFFACFRPSLAG